MSIFKKSNIPNFLSLFRILLTPVFIWLFLVAKKHGLAIGVFLLAGATDVCDGFLARRFKWISPLGKVLDPLADKCMQVSALICLGSSGLVPLWIVIILVSKEVALLVGALFAIGRERVCVESDWYGKAGTVAFYIIATLLVLIEDMSDTVRVLLGTILVLIMVFALIMYILNYRRNVIHRKNG